MIVEVTITTRIVLPEGATPCPSGTRKITLKDGTTVKPFIILEKDDVHDMSYDEATELGLDYDEVACEVHEVTEE